VRYIALFVVCVSSALAQPYEIGAAFGYGWYRSGTVFSGAGTVTAGIRNRFAAGVVLGYEPFDYVSGEIRYLYHDGHPFLSGPGLKADIQGQSQAIAYDTLFYFKKRDRRLRPFLSGGMGAKGYIIAGPAPYPQPVPNIATLEEVDQWKVVFSVGGGVKYQLREHLLVRVDFRDYLTTFPRQQILPAPHNTARGIFEQFTPMFGLSYTF
jgi:hypothetical protein